MPLPARMGRFNRHVTNRLTRPLAGWLPGFAILTHKGRRSGRTYRIPINAFRDGTGYVFALTYGAETDWVRNVLAAGGAEIENRGRHIRLTNPRIVTDTAKHWAPLPVRLALRLFGVPQIMRLTRVPAGRAADVAGGQPAPPAAS
ncbi:MAG TPA: nitroreductase family deazaflavin-dependent oxidoreductase [Ktedonobacterales bacterium]